MKSGNKFPFLRKKAIQPSGQLLNQSNQNLDPHSRADFSGAPYQPAHPSVGPEWFSALRFLLSTIGAVFLAEVFAMIVLLSFKTLPYYLQTLIDAGIMVVLISPVIYLLSFRPLLQHIEKRRRAEQQVQEMALFPTLNPDAVLQVNAHGQITKTNPAGTRMGLIVGAQLSDLIPDLREMDLPSCIAEGKTQQIHETQLGERVLQWVIHGAPELGLAFLYSTDVTERKRAEAEIYRLSSIVQQTADTVVVTNREGVIEYVNPAFELQTGYRREEVLGQTPSVLKSGVHDEDFYQELWETILSGENYQNEITNRSKSGALFHEVKTIMPLRDASGNITHFVATGKDITDRKEAEEKLKHAYDELELRVQQRTEELVAANINLLAEVNERKKIQSALEQSEQELKASEEKAQNLVQYAPAAIYEIDFLGRRFLSVNDIACQWSGYTREEMLCMNPLDLMDEESKTRFQERIKAKRSGEDIDEAVEYRILAKDGHEIIAEMHVGAFTFKEGAPESVLVVAHDITRRKRAEEAIRAANEELTRFNRAMIGRELRMIELKKEVNELCGQASQPPRYHLESEKEV
ncbi:MAG TPA: PAS domain S-box protein [Anaerolineales bacterium]|nr:PAS domain S-box protein [Anaerolineales bacterium]